MEVDGKFVLDDGSPVEFRQSPNCRGTVAPRFLVLHYTAGTTLDGAANWFANPAAKASAHFVIGRNGQIVQMVPLDKRAWHAGESSWQSLTGMNAYSIGIELVNAGKLVRTESGLWRSWSGTSIPSDEVVQLQHRNEQATAGWHVYAEPQIAAVLRLGLALHTAFGFEGVLGHDDIAPQRKVDPGPAFPMASITGRILGRR